MLIFAGRGAYSLRELLYNYCDNSKTVRQFNKTLSKDFATGSCLDEEQLGDSTDS